MGNSGNSEEIQGKIKKIQYQILELKNRKEKLEFQLENSVFPRKKQKKAENSKEFHGIPEENQEKPKEGKSILDAFFED